MITKKLANYALSLSLDDASPKTIRIAKRNITDIIGCILAGSNDRSLTMAKQMYSELGLKGDYPVIGDPSYRTDLLHSVMLNAMEAHVRDFDDIVIAVEGHATISVFPVALMVGEYVGASGKEVLDAYITGVEVAGLLGKSLFSAGYKSGWDASGTIGIFGATAAAGKLLSLDEQALATSFGIAVNEASGTRSVYGYMNKDLSAGHTAMKGVFCALAAKKGFDSCPDSFENRSGYFKTFCDGIDEVAFDKLINSGDSTFIDPGIIVKRFPSCRDAHSGADAALELALEYDIDPKKVVSGTCKASSVTFYNDRFPYPNTPSEAKFSMPYQVALILLYRNQGLLDFAGDIIEDIEALELCRKFKVIEDDSFAPGVVEISITLDDGTTYQKTLSHAEGDPDRELPEEFMARKFSDCYSFISHKDKAKELYDWMNEFEKLENVKGVVDKINSMI